MPRIFKIVSIAVHVIVVGFAFVAELTALGPLPVPRQPLSFAGSMPIRIVDIPLPAPPPSSVRGGTTAIDSTAAVAPIAPPTGIQPEVAGTSSGGDSASALNGVEAGFSTSVGLTPIENIPPPPPAPRAPIRVVGMQAPRKLVHVDPVYPGTARVAHVEGVVILEATLDTRGRVVDVRILRSVRLLDDAAIDAVRQWIYTPTLLNGVAVPVVMTITVNFRLGER